MATIIRRRLEPEHARHDVVDYRRSEWRDYNAALECRPARDVFEKPDYLWARLAVHIRAEHLDLSPALLAASERRRHEEVDAAPSPGEVRMAVERLREGHDFVMRELAAAVNAARASASQSGPTDRERLLQIRGEHRRRPTVSSSTTACGR